MAIFTRQNGILTMQDGKTFSDIVSIKDFISNCNASGKLTNPNLQFLSTLAFGFVSNEEFNKFLTNLNNINRQYGDFFLTMKAKGAKVQAPDAEYWNAELKSLTTSIEAGKIDKIKGCADLSKRFGEVVNACVDANIEEAKQYGITPPLKTTQIQKEDERSK